MQLSNGDVIEFGNTYDCSVYAFDAKTETWENRGEVPGLRYVTAITELPDGRVFAFSSQTCVRAHPGNNTPVVLLYDPVSRTWTTTASPLLDRWLVRVATLDCGQVAVFYGGEKEREVELYDPLTDSWSIAAHDGPWLVYDKSPLVRIPGLGIVTPPGRVTWDQKVAVPLLLESK
jgi:hypothetical protein